MSETDRNEPDAEALVVGLRERLRVVEDSIRAVGRDHKQVTIVAVTKGFGSQHVRAAHAAGLRVFGENYADELVKKANALGELVSDIAWTFQGRLQTNKINRLAPFVSLWQSVGSSEQAAALGKRVPNAAVFIQMKLTERSEQGGADISEIARVVDDARTSGLDVRGLMGIGPDTDDTADRRKAFALLRAQTERLGLSETSMGMSDDYLDAVVEGATMIRLGSILFGRRGPVA